MICCINTECQKPLNSEDAANCRSCGSPLVYALRGRYRPIKLLGQGGFGRTYLAQDQDRLNSKCVIKQFAPQVRSAHAKAKAVVLFNQEAVRLHELGEHPQIPALLAYFEEDGYLYLVQQYVEGPSLAQELTRYGPLDESQLRLFLLDLLPVLQFVHENQVIHRDITPMNILRRAIDGRVVLIDFGVAKQLNIHVPAQPGTRIGTEGYSPMEQFRGGRAYPASDLYSLGATCLHLLTNTRPDFLYDPLNGEWIWQSYLREQQRPISAGLTAILNKMLQDLVNDRYQSAAEVLNALQALEPVSSISVSSAITLVDPPGSLQPVVPVAQTPATSRSPVAGSNQVSVSAPQSAGGATPVRSASTPAPTASNNHLSSPPPVASPAVAGRMTSPPPPERSPLAPPRSSPPRPPAEYSRPPSGPPRPPSGPPLPPPAIRVGSMGMGASSPSGHLRCQCLYTIAAHTSWVTGVSISPIHAVFATCGLDDQVKLWDVKTGQLRQSLVGHSRGVNAVTFLPKSGLVLSGSDDYTVKIWNGETGAVIQTLKGHDRDVTAVVCSVDERYILSGGADRSIRIWGVDTGQLLKVPIGVTSIIRTLAVSPDGNVFVSGGLDRKLKLWSMKTAELAREWTAHTAAITTVAISANSQLIGSAGKDKVIKLWNLNTGRIVREFKGHSREVNAIAIAPNNQWLISGSSDTSIRIWEIATGKCAAILTDHGNSVNAIAILPDGQYFISGSSDCSVKVWQLS